MNGTLACTIRRQLLPALECNQGFVGVYTRGGGATGKAIVVVPRSPDWQLEDEKGTVIEEYTELIFLVSVDGWNATGFGLPQQSDRLAVTLADGVPRVYALFAKSGDRPFRMDDLATCYFLRMKWVKR